MLLDWNAFDQDAFDRDTFDREQHPNAGFPASC
jgi:hypothetical protein